MFRPALLFALTRIFFGRAIASVLINNEVDQCAKDIEDRWVQKLEGVDIWAPSHCIGLRRMGCRGALTVVQCALKGRL